MTVPREPLYLCIYVPEFPTQARLRHRPEQRQQSLVILEGVAPLQQVYSMTRKALHDGVTHGMTRSELDSFADVVMLTRSLPEERSAQIALIELAGNFTPRAQVIAGTDTACTLVLDITGTERVFGSPQKLALRVKHAVELLGLHARLGVSYNFHTAVCAAPYASATGMVISRGQEAKALSLLPLVAISPAARHAETFALWGLHTCGDIAKLPEVDLIARLGQAGRRLRLLARGELPHLLVPETERFSLEEHVTFESSVDVLDSLLFVLGPMLDQLIQRAGARSLALASVKVRLALDGAAAQEEANTAAEASEHIRTVKPALPLMDRDLLLKLIHLDLQAHAPSAAVTAIHLSAEPGDRSKVQLGLFSPQLPEPTRLDITLARIAALVGEDRVGRPMLLDTHRPDSFVMERYTSPANLSAGTAPGPGGTIALRRLRPALDIPMRLLDGRPATFQFEGRQHEVRASYGPWRQSGEWWSDAIWSRDEWDVCASTREGSVLLCVVVHDLLRKHWQLEAVYD